MKLKLHRDSPKSTSTSVKKSWISINHVKMKKGGKVQSTICNKFWIFNKVLVFYLSVVFLICVAFAGGRNCFEALFSSYNWYIFWAVLSKAFLWCNLLLNNVRYIVSPLYNETVTFQRFFAISCSMLPAVLYIGCNNVNTNPFCLRFVLLELVDPGCIKHLLRRKNCTKSTLLLKRVLLYFTKCFSELKF